MHIFAQGVAAESRAEPKAVQPAAVRRPTEAVPQFGETVLERCALQRKTRPAALLYFHEIVAAGCAQKTEIGTCKRRIALLVCVPLLKILAHVRR